MAPRKEQTPVITPASVALGLSAPESALQALSQLSTVVLDEADLLQYGIPGKLVSLLQQQDKSVKLLACRQLATYAASAGLQPAVGSLEALQALWVVLEAYNAAEAAITAALSDPAAAKAAASKKQTGGKDVAGDPEEWLPGPSKYLLEATLRTLASLLGPLGNQQQQEQQPQEDVQPSTGPWPGMTAEAACGMHTWLAAQDVTVLACLLRHPSARVQMRACRLAHQLAHTLHWADAFAAAGGVAAGMRLVSCDSSASVRLAATRLLQRLGEVSVSATVLMVVEPSQLAAALVLVVLEAGAAPVPVQPKAKAAAGDAAKLGSSEAVPIQLAAAGLLALLCSQGSSLSRYVVESGGLAALQGLLPEPPEPPLTAQEPTEIMSSRGNCADAAVADGARTPHKSGTSKQATPRGAPQTEDKTPQQAASHAAAPGDAARQATPRSAALAGTPRTADGNAAASPTSAQPADAPGGFSMPAVKTPVPQIQAHVLKVIAAMVLHQHVKQLLLEQALTSHASLVRMLLHMFAPAVLPEQHDAYASPDGVLGTADDAAARAGTSVKGGPGSTAAKPAVAAGTKKPGAATGGAHEQTPPGAGTTTPRKGAASSSSGAKEQKLALQAADAQPSSPLAPPFSTAVKAAALDCLAHLAQDKQAVTLMSAQLVPLQQPLARQSMPLSGPEDMAAAETQQGLGVDGVSMLQQLLEDLVLLGDAVNVATVADSVSNTVSYDNSTSTGPAPAAEQQDAQPMLMPLPSAAVPPTAGTPAELAVMLDGACAVLAGLAECLEQQQVLALPVLPALQAVAQYGLAQQASPHTQQAVARALLLLPEEAFVPPARPPLPSPPATPPAPPLPTSQFAWDALGRPYITDGAVVLSSA